MQFLSLEPVEFRRVVSSKSKKDPSVNNYYYFFEDDFGSFQIFCRKEFVGLSKGDIVNLTFETRVWDNKLQFDLVEVSKVG